MPIGPSWPSSMSASPRRSRWPRTANPSTRQYALADHARALGWPTERVLVIDEDLGLSGRTADIRLGFQRLLAEVSMDHVGLVLGLEMSRLSRSCKDWHHLLEVCGHLRRPAGRPGRDLRPVRSQRQALARPERPDLGTGAPYDPQPLVRGKLNKARRGELIINAPIGYVKTPAGGLALDPDEQVQAVVRLIFDKFDELGTAHAVTRVPEAQSHPARDPPSRRAESGEP